MSYCKKDMVLDPASLCSLQLTSVRPLCGSRSALPPSTLEEVCLLSVWPVIDSDLWTSIWRCVFCFEAVVFLKAFFANLGSLQLKEIDIFVWLWEGNQGKICESRQVVSLKIQSHEANHFRYFVVLPVNTQFEKFAQTWCPYTVAFLNILFTSILGEFSMYFLIWNINFLEVPWKKNFLENFLRNFLGISKPKLEQGILQPWSGWALSCLGNILAGKKTQHLNKETNNYCLGGHTTSFVSGIYSRQNDSISMSARF